MADRKPSAANPRSRSTVDNDPQARLPPIPDLNLNLNLRSATAAASSPFSSSSLSPRIVPPSKLREARSIKRFRIPFYTSLASLFDPFPFHHIVSPTKSKYSCLPESLAPLRVTLRTKQHRRETHLLDKVLLGPLLYPRQSTRPTTT
ncbi:hypothetical protein F4819DRAFT_266943 [Hypoxylon fuscum]|nr:hypothetical protein F4819DRAFT_266943 [Hypoxylon fuscum]